MARLWIETDEEWWQASETESPASSSVWIDSDLRYRDILLGALAHLLGLVRYRVLRGAPPVWSLADEIDYAAFCRRLDEPLNPEIEARIEAELDIFEGVKCYRA